MDVVLPVAACLLIRASVSGRSYRYKHVRIRLGVFIDVGIETEIEHRKSHLNMDYLELSILVCIYIVDFSVRFQFVIIRAVIVSIFWRRPLCAGWGKNMPPGTDDDTRVVRFVVPTIIPTGRPVIR